MNFFKLYIGDYQRDTAHLSLPEHGAYLLMLQHYYATERPLPTGKALHRMLRAQDKTERDAIDAVAAQFWTVTEAGLVNERADVEITKAGAQAETNARIAREREAKRKAARKKHDPSTNRATNGQPNHSQTPEEPPCSPPEGGNPSAKPAGRKPRAITLAAYLSDCESADTDPIPETDAVWRTAEAAGIPREWVALAWWAFQGRYLANPGDKAKTYASWPQAFRNAVRENWLKLWWPTDDGGYRLSPAGVQAQREMERAA